MSTRNATKVNQLTVIDRRIDQSGCCSSIKSRSFCCERAAGSDGVCLPAAIYLDRPWSPDGRREEEGREGQVFLILTSSFTFSFCSSSSHPRPPSPSAPHFHLILFTSSPPFTVCSSFSPHFHLILFTFTSSSSPPHLHLLIHLHLLLLTFTCSSSSSHHLCDVISLTSCPQTT